MNCTWWDDLRKSCPILQFPSYADCCDFIKENGRNDSLYNDWCTRCGTEESNPNNFCLEDKIQTNFLYYWKFLSTVTADTSDPMVFINIIFQSLFQTIHYNDNLDVMQAFMNFSLEFLSKDYFIDELWSNINGKFIPKKSREFAVEEMFSWGMFHGNLGSCFDSSKACQELKEKTKDMLKDESFLNLYLKDANQPTTANENNTYVFLPLCKFDTDHKHPLQPCNLFDHQLSIPLAHNCYTFNGDVLQPKYNDQVGPNGGLTFILDFSFLTPIMMQNNPAIMILHEPGVPPDTKHFKTSFIEIQPGVELTYGANAIINEGTEDFKAMNIKDRKCRHENDPLIKTIYGDSTSDVSCLLSKNILNGINKCGCYPWYLLHLNDDNGTICEAFGMACYKNIVTNVQQDKEFMAECRPPCNSIKYLTYLNSQRDSNARSKVDLLRQNIYQYFMDDTIKILEHLHVNETLETYEEFRWSRLSIINVNFQDPMATVVIKDAKVTFADMLGTIGGTFGIFLGLSIVGLVDSTIEFYLKFKANIVNSLNKL
jgi:hypothetical protein